MTRFLVHENFHSALTNQIVQYCQRLADWNRNICFELVPFDTTSSEFNSLTVYVKNSQVAGLIDLFVN